MTKPASASSAEHRRFMIKDEPTDTLLELTKGNKPKPLPNEPYNQFVVRRFKENGERFKHHEIKTSDGQRVITFEQACRRYHQRFTMEHVPSWADKPVVQADGSVKYPAPHYRSDKEWYDNTEFMGEGTTAVAKYCRSMNRTYPIGRWLDEPYRNIFRRTKVAQMLQRVLVEEKPLKAKKSNKTKPQLTRGERKSQREPKQIDKELKKVNKQIDKMDREARQQVRARNRSKNK